MVKKEARCTELDRPWGEVVQAVFEKYPNPHSEGRLYIILQSLISDPQRLECRTFSTDTSQKMANW